MDEKRAEKEGKTARAVQQRRRFSAADKKRMLDEATVPGESIWTIARKYIASLQFASRKRWAQRMRLFQDIEGRLLL